MKLQLQWLSAIPAQDLLETLVQHADKEPNVSLITAVAGSGKTRLLHEVATQLTKNTTLWVATMDAQCADPSSALFAALGEHNMMIALELTERLHLLLKQRAVLGQRTILLIDNAHLLPIELLHAILEAGQFAEAIAPERYFFSVQLFAESGLEIFIENLHPLRYQFAVLEPMTAAQVKLFAEHFYRSCGVNMDLSGQEVARLHGLSYGYPGRLLRLLVKPPRNKRMQVMTAITCISVMAMLATASWFYFAQPAIPMLPPNVPTGGESVIASQTEPAPTVPNITITPPPAPSHVSTPDAAEDWITIPTHIVPPKIPPTAPAQSITPAPIVQHAPQSNKPESTGTTAGKSATATATTPVKPKPATAPVTTAVKPTTASTTDTTSVKPKPTTVPATATNPSAVVKSEHYVITLSTGETVEQVQAQLKNRPIPGTPRIVKLKSATGWHYAAQIGPYESQKQAQQGLKALPASVQTLKPTVQKAP